RRMRLTLQQVDIRQVIEEAVSVVHSLFRRKGLYLEVDIAQDLPLLSLDPLRIRQVLLNLLSNASRHTERGGVTVTARLQDRQVHVSVADTGSGIAPEQQDRVFEEFGRVGTPDGRSQEGTGLGLALSKRFVELHGGSMGFRSLPGEGSTFYFSLPVRPHAAPSAAELVRIPGREALSKAEHPTLLLVAGAGPLQLAALRRVEGVGVLEVREPGDAPALVERYRPAALVVNSEGGSLPAVLQSWAPHLPADLPIITFALQDRFTSPRPLNVHEFLLKPVTRDGLIRAITRLHGSIETILIVDDDLQLVELLSRMLESAGRGWRTIKCFGGQEALNRMFREPPDAVLLDLALPDVDGLVVLETMRSSRSLAATPVIVVSAREHLEMIQGGSTLSITRGRGFSGRELLTYLRLLVSAQPSAAADSAPAPAPPAAPTAAQAS
ncbi:MAG: ATP-binding protein, partial [Anaerolineae bacterium]|nr:ATP-binding protein [Anaerolineae bacterium]